jgi:hypothetical protein
MGRRECRMVRDVVVEEVMELRQPMVVDVMD